ncbi:hypothetical protein HQ571_03045 [Candidatus Kuenenbacteria bacterium]|nr:hypothetical protein [Candidatus Kuenenbacteria bacterium]
MTNNNDFSATPEEKAEYEKLIKDPVGKAYTSVWLKEILTKFSFWKKKEKIKKEDEKKLKKVRKISGNK